MSVLSNGTKKAKCYYQKQSSIYDRVNMLDEFISYCENEAVKTVFINGFYRKLKICGGDKCLGKATADLNLLKQEWKQKQATARKLKRLRIKGFSDSQIWQHWDIL